MAIEKLIKVEYDLEKILTEILKNPRNSLDIQGVITLSQEISQKSCITSLRGGIKKEKFSIATLYLSDKYAEFHDEFTQTANTNPELKPLYDYLIKNGWGTNLD